MTDDPTRAPRAPQAPPHPTTPATLTVAFHPPQYARTLPPAALAHLDARLAHLHARTPEDALHATLRDAARLLGAHLTFRAPGRVASAHPWQADSSLLGVGVRRAGHLLHLRGAAPHPPGPLLAAVDRWPGGTVLVARRGVICAQLNLACDLDRLQLGDLLLGDLQPGNLHPGHLPGGLPDTVLYAHRLRPGGQLDARRTPGWPAP